MKKDEDLLQGVPKKILSLGKLQNLWSNANSEVCKGTRGCICTSLDTLGTSARYLVMAWMFLEPNITHFLNAQPPAIVTLTFKHFWSWEWVPDEARERARER